MIEHELYSLPKLYKKPVSIVNTLSWTLDELYKDPFGEEFTKLFSNAKNAKNLEILMVDKTDDIHMTDLNIIMPLELESFLS